MKLDIYYFQGKRTPELYRLLDEVPQVPPFVFSTQYRWVGDDEGSLETVIEQWTAGSGNESNVFATRRCRDCGEVFDSTDRSALAAAVHIRDTGHDVEDSPRDIMVGDVVGEDGRAYVLTPSGFVRQEQLDPEIPDTTDE